MINKGSKACYLRKTKTVTGLSVIGGELRVEQKNPWTEEKCGKPMPEPQVKRIEDENIVYCRGFKIKLDNLPERSVSNMPSVYH
jgi:hypothetical protein